MTQRPAQARRFVKDVTVRAREQARLLGAPRVEAEHLLLALAATPRWPAGALLADEGLNRAGVLAALDTEFERSLGAVGILLLGFHCPRSACRSPASCAWANRPSSPSGARCCGAPSAVTRASTRWCCCAASCAPTRVWWRVPSLPPGPTARAAGARRCGAGRAGAEQQRRERGVPRGGSGGRRPPPASPGLAAAGQAPGPSAVFGRARPWAATTILGTNTTARGLQRRRDRHHHHHHGAGAARAARRPRLGCAWRRCVPVFLSYVLSFVNLGIYWNNHHHMLIVTEHVSGGDPVGQPAPAVLAVADAVRDAWMGENDFAPTPTAAVRRGAAAGGRRPTTSCRPCILRGQGKDSLLAQAIGRDVKGKISPLLYVVAIAASSGSPGSPTASTCWWPLIWLLPDRRIERAVAGRKARMQGEPSAARAPGEDPEAADERRAA